jgi:hypothetical protein
MRGIAAEGPHPIEHRRLHGGRCRNRSDMFVRVFPQCHGSRRYGVPDCKLSVIGFSD